MLASYGYEDGSGTYYMTVVTARCSECEQKPCLEVCPSGLLQKELDDFDEEIIAVPEAARHTIAAACTECRQDEMPCPCETVCPYGALSHTW